MSVEKIAALPQKSPIADAGAHSQRASERLRTESFFGTLNNSGTAPLSAGLHVESLSLPLVEAAPSAGTPEALTRAAYNSWLSTAARPVVLREGRLSTESVVSEVKALLQKKAAEQSISVKRLIQNIRPTPYEKLPSSNTSDAVYSLQTQLIAPAEQTDARLIKLYLTRVSRRQWEIVVFRQDGVATGFPYLAPPINADRLIIDPSSGQVLSCVAMSIAMHRFVTYTPLLGVLDGLFPSLVIVAVIAAVWLKASYVVVLLGVVLAAAIFMLSIFGVSND